MHEVDGEAITESPAELAVMAASKIDVKSGDTLVLRSDRGLTPSEVMAVKVHYADAGKDVSVFSLPSDMSIESLDEEEMRLAGWVRST